MRSWKENFGSFFTNSCDWDSKKTIEIIRKDGMTGEEMVRQAIALAKQYNCSIVKPVEYVPEIVGGKVIFTVECHTLTYRYFYEHGKTYTLHSSEVRRATSINTRRSSEQGGAYIRATKNSSGSPTTGTGRFCTILHYARHGRPQADRQETSAMSMRHFLMAGIAGLYVRHRHPALRRHDT